MLAQRKYPAELIEERERIRELEKEVTELRRANEILKAAAVFSPPNSTRSPPR